MRGDRPTARGRSAACVRHGAHLLRMTRNTAVERAIAAIDEAAWTPVCYPGAVQDPDTGAWISMPKSPTSAIPPSRPPPTRSPPDWWCAGSRTPGFPMPVPGMAVSPVLHQHRPARRRGRHHPPPARDHRNRVRRPDRRTAGAHPLRALRRQLAPGCCAPRSPTTCCAPAGALAGRPALPEARGIDAAATIIKVPARLTCTRSADHPAPTHPLALVDVLACAVAQHHRIQPTTAGDT